MAEALTWQVAFRNAAFCLEKAQIAPATDAATNLIEISRRWQSLGELLRGGG